MFRFLDGSSKGSGFVRFGNQTDQQMALVEMHRTRIGNNRMVIKLAGPRGERLDRNEPISYSRSSRSERHREERHNKNNVSEL